MEGFDCQEIEERWNVGTIPTGNATFGHALIMVNIFKG